MNDTTASTITVVNMTRNERSFRILSGMGLLIAVISGTIASAASIFTVAAIAVYLVTTAIISADPLYSLINRITSPQAWMQGYGWESHV